ncbi:hypothetical protein [Curvivirga sp.]|uniref:hypothetical protein n=1 Tax=Curvivirga sp. TaxID=2856848 RepID=UPI003B5C0C77
MDAVLKFIDDGIGYGSAASTRSAINEIWKLRNLIGSENSLILKSQKMLKFNNTDEFDDWNKVRYGWDHEFYIQELMRSKSVSNSGKAERGREC